MNKLIKILFAVTGVYLSANATGDVKIQQNNSISAEKSLIPSEDKIKEFLIEKGMSEDELLYLEDSESNDAYLYYIIGVSFKHESLDARRLI